MQTIPKLLDFKCYMFYMYVGYPNAAVEYLDVKRYMGTNYMTRKDAIFDVIKPSSGKYIRSNWLAIVVR